MQYNKYKLMSYTVSLFHIVIGTHQRKMSINEKHKTELYKYIWGIIEKCNCKLICINGIPDHIHLLVDLNSTISIAQLVRDIKRFSSLWIKSSEYFPLFDGWGKEYAAFSCSKSMSEQVQNYIKNQEEHHSKEEFISEYQRLIIKHGLCYHKSSEE